MSEEIKTLPTIRLTFTKAINKDGEIIIQPITEDGKAIPFISCKVEAARENERADMFFPTRMTIVVWVETLGNNRPNIEDRKALEQIESENKRE